MSRAMVLRHHDMSLETTMPYFLRNLWVTEGLSQWCCRPGTLSHINCTDRNQVTSTSFCFRHKEICEERCVGQREISPETIVLDWSPKSILRLTVTAGWRKIISRLVLLRVAAKCDN